MAATLNEDERNLAAALTPQEIPSKLRCGLCNSVAVDAVKLPCCETSICSNCQAELPEQCTICEHQPLSPDVCTPMKSLRMTIKAHLKTELKRRTAQSSVSNAAPAVTAPTPTPVPTEPPQASATSETERARTPAVEDTTTEPQDAGFSDLAKNDGAVAETIEQGDAAQDAQLPDEFANQANVDGDTLEENTEDDVADEDTADKSDVEIITERPESETQQKDVGEYGEEDQIQGQEEQDANQMNEQMGYGFSQNQQGLNNMGNMGNMDFSAMGGFNPMMAMQSSMGMPGFGMGMQNMMGMPGMSMDPSMMMNNNFGGMGGMNGMNMNMNMMGMMGGGFDQMSGMGMNGFGGYNRFGNNYNQQQPFHPNARGFNRPYGRGGRGFRGAGGYGFGGRGRGGFNQFGQNQGFHNGFQNGVQNGMQNRMQPNSVGPQSVSQPGEDGPAEPGARRGSPSYESMQGTNEGPGDANFQSRQSELEAQGNTNKAGDETTDTVKDVNGNKQTDDVDMQEQDATRAETTTDPAQTDQSNFNGAQSNQHFDGSQAQAFAHNDGAGYNGTGAFAGQNGVFAQQAQHIPAPAPPVNAPTGPKAMRQGLPNSGWYSRPQASQIASNITVKPDNSRHALAGPGSVRGRSAERDGHGEGRGVDASRSRSRSRHRSKRHSKEEEESYESDATYERRKERERRKRKERERRYDDDRETVRSSGKARSRSASLADDSSSRRHRHRDDEKCSRRDRSRDKRKSSHRERSVDATGDDDSSRRKSKNRRSRDGDDDSVREKDKTSRRASRRDPDDDTTSSRKDRSSRHGRHSSRERADQPPDEIGFKIKGSHSNKINPTGMPPPASRRDSERRRESIPDSSVASTAAAVDPYAAERERHKLERAAREQQRRQSSQSLGKRGREEEGEDGGRSERKKREGRSRKISAKYEGEIGDGEREREMGRWR